MGTEITSSESRDYREFVGSLEQLHDNLLHDYVYDDSCIVIALSRKGPKMLELVFSEEELSKLNIVTEFAVPIVFSSLKVDIKYNIYIVDDAVYFGSTLKNLIAEIKEYASLYGLNIYITAYVALIDKDSLKFESVELKGITGHRSGYGHYFVRQVMSRCRQLHRCMEVEFPVITYEFPDNVNIVKVASALGKEYEHIYLSSYPEEQVVTIVLPNDGSQFSKMRFYSEGNKLHIAFIAPRNIEELAGYEHLMDSYGVRYQLFWSRVCHYIERINEQKTSVQLRRNCERSLVVLANFIYSFNLYVRQRLNLQQIFASIGMEASHFYLLKRSTFRLIGIKALDDELRQMLYNDMRLVTHHQLGTSSILPSLPRQFYEEKGSPTAEERESLATHNLHMIRNSMNLSQALSAIVFNQNLFVERWTRNGYAGERRHLWFGYTHKALESLIDRYARFPMDEVIQYKIHEWLDGRIDMGCVVPQYIKDVDNKTWVRVFRPGENEDVLLSHLARFVIHVYDRIDKQLNIGYCPKEVLCKVLSIVWRQFSDEKLYEQFAFSLKIEDGELCLSQNELPTRLTVVRYLQKMYILDVTSDEEVKPSPRISDPDLLHYTTLDIQIQRKIDQFIASMFKEMRDWNVDIYDANSYFNHFLNRDVTTEVLQQVVKEEARKLKLIVEKIEVTLAIHPEEPLSDEQKLKVFEVFDIIRQYDEHPNFYLASGMTEDEYWRGYRTIPRVKVQHDFKTLYQLINLIVGVYMMHAERIRNYLRNEESMTMMTMLRMDVLRKYLEQIEKEKNYHDLRYGITLPGLMKGVLDRMISE